MTQDHGRAQFQHAGVRAWNNAGPMERRAWMRRISPLLSHFAPVLLCLATVFLAPQARAEEVDIPDANLEAALRAALGIPSDPLQDTNLATLAFFDASSLGIADLTGLEYCTGLLTLTLASNQIVDLTPLAGLSLLSFIDLTSNRIFDVTPLEGISSLSSLTLDSNRFVDVTPLADLPSLTYLSLSGSPVCDLESLVNGTGLEAGSTLVVANNPLTTTACATQIPALEARGVQVNSGSSCGSGGVAECGVTVPDFNLEAALRSALAIPTAPLLDSDLASLTLLNADALGIVDLTGMEFCTGLTSLDLAGNEIVDLTPLAGLTALTSVDLSSNQIADVTPLAGLTNLESIELDNNLICDIAPLVDNTGLATGDSVVVLGNPLIASACATQIPALIGRGATVDSGAACDSGGFANCWIDIPDPNLEAALRTTLGIPTAPLQDTDLALLTIFSAFDRGIVDLTGLEYCTNLEKLFLFANEIADLTPIAGLTSLTNLELLQNQVTDVTPIAGLTGLTSLGLGDNKITDVSPLEGLTNLSFLSLVGNQICDLTPLVDNAGLATDDSVFVGLNPLLAVACGTQIPALSSRGVTVDSGTACNSGGETYCLVEPVNIPDPNLEAALRDALGIPSAPLTYGNLASLTFLFISGRGIIDLTGLEYCVNLTNLSLENNQIVDLTPLSGLVSLTQLSLGRNQITDVSPLSGLTGLTELFLGNNQIADLGPLSDLSLITNLSLQFNQITDLTPLSGLTSLTNANLYNNQIVDLTPLSGLSTLDELDLSSNQIIDAAPLAGLTSLTYISLDGNQVTDIAPLSGLTALTLLELRNNQITNVAPLATLSSLEELVLTGNPVANVTPLTGLTSLNFLLLDGTLVCDLTPLVDNAAFASGSYVSVEGNSLSADTCTNQIPTLTGRGVTVESGTACDGGGIAECPSLVEGEGEGVVEGEGEGVIEGVGEGVVEGAGEGVNDGEGSTDGEGVTEGTLDGEGSADGEGVTEGTLDGEGSADGEGVTEGTLDGEGSADGEGVTEGTLDGEGSADGEGVTEGTLDGEGSADGEGVTEGASDGEGAVDTSFEQLLQSFAAAESTGDSTLTLAEIQSVLPGFTQQELDDADYNGDGELSVAELLQRVGGGILVHADTNGDSIVQLTELIRLIQLYNAGLYACAENAGATEDGFSLSATLNEPACVLHSVDQNGDKTISLSELLRGIQLYNLGGYTWCPGGGTEDGFCG